VIDVAAVRADTPGAETVVHFNNAGASLMPRPVLDTVTGYLAEESVRGGYETAEAHDDDLAAVYEALGTLVGAGPDEIALFESATSAWDMVFYSLPFAPGDRILTTTSEYSSNYIAYLHITARTGAVVEVVPDTPGGEIDVAALEAMLDERVRVIAINHMPTSSGLVNPAASVGEVARRHGVFYLLDACQTVGQMPIDVAAIGCDALTSTSRKFLRGPRGAGFAYVRRDIIADLDPPFLDNLAADWVSTDRFEIRSDARRFESWECSPALHMGLGAAARYALSVGLDDIWARDQRLAGELRRGLHAIDGLRVRDFGSVQGAIVTFTADGLPPEEMKAELRDRGINVSVATPYSARLDMERRGLDGLVRASVHYFNTEDEVARLVDAVAVAVSDRRTAAERG
jgi:selenocysteine lyase/cysteine desulfurase